MARLEQADAAKKSDNKISKGQVRFGLGLQEAEDVELVDVFDTSVGECEDCPSELQECNVQRCVDLCSDIST